jgi:DNA primase
MHLDPRTIDEVRRRADIYDVVSERVVLKRTGKDFRGLCPFHDSKNSLTFSINSSKNIFKCFSCGAAGDAIKFLERLDKVSYLDVVLDLARRYNIPVHASPEERADYQKKLSREQQLLEILQQAALFYHHALHSEQGQVGQAYMEKRGLSPATQETFLLGYAPSSWNALATHLVERKGYPAPLVEATGLIRPRQSGSGYYDYFRERIMIPICDLRGRVVGFGGRSLGDEQPKYLNSPETELFEKSKLLYGLDKAKNAIAKADNAVVVEGYFDVISLHQAGIQQVVASLGTALSEHHVKQLLKLSASQNIVLNFDADTAGEKATQRAIEYFKQIDGWGIRPRVLTMPQGKDPDEYIQHHGMTSYLQLIQEAPVWRDWIIEKMFRDRDVRNPQDFQLASQEAVTLLCEMSNRLERQDYLELIAKRLASAKGFLTVQIEDELKRRVRSRLWNRPVAQRQQDTKHRLREAEFQLLQIFLNIPEYRADISRMLDEEELEFSIPMHRKIWRLASTVQEDKPEHLVPELKNLVASDVQLSDYLYTLLWVSEMNRVSLMRPSLVFRTDIATMALEVCQKRWLMWTDEWEKSSAQGELEDAQLYWESLLEEKTRMRDLQQRCRSNWEEMKKLEDVIVMEDEVNLS